MCLNITSNSIEKFFVDKLICDIENYFVISTYIKFQISMKKIIYTFVILFISQLNFANELDSILSKAREFGRNKNYTEAIKTYESYIKNAGEINLKEVYIEVANCYFLNEKKEIAVKYIKKAIIKYGFTEDEFIYSTTLNENLSKYALSVIYDDYFDLRAQYLSTVK